MWARSRPVLALGVLLAACGSIRLEDRTREPALPGSVHRPSSEDPRSLLDELAYDSLRGGVVLVKGSRGTHLELVVRAIRARAEDTIFLVDPMGNLMMRFPKEADPTKVKKDLSKLLNASRIG